MDITNIKTRLKNIDPVVVDIATAIGLAALVCFQIWFVQYLRRSGTPPQGFEGLEHRFRDIPKQIGVLPYVLAVVAFLPLSFRRIVPWLSLVFAGTATIFYLSQPMPPSFLVLAPMVAMYTLAAEAKKRRVGLLALLVIVLVVAVPAFAFLENARWVGDAVGTFTLVSAAAILGEAERNRRSYVIEVERRAAEAERTREEEALRRVEEERVHIAREVHDILAHSLSIVSVQSAAAEAVVEKNPAQAKESLRNIRATAKGALGELRSMLNVLRSGESETPLEPAADLTWTDQLVARVRDAGIDVKLAVAGDLAAVPAYASVSGYRIVQEALTNVMRHAQATSASVSIVIGPKTLAIEVSDDGHGPDAASNGGGHGLRGMRERVEALAGSFAAGRCSDDRGFCVTAIIPLSRSNS
ncbi:MAG TPA: sensor histidine kinase [Coriobacteriia bacterium]|nr:sensor histidine kinase [Coriobacteriia bacterium]